MEFNDSLKTNLSTLLTFVAIIWVVEIINLIMGHQLCSFGIFPRRISGLLGIPLSPFLHYGIRHVFVNTLPFIILGGLVLTQGSKVFFEVSLFIIFSGGAAVWLLGRSSFHVGASGLIFGYFGYLIAIGWYSGSATSFLIALATLFLYGGMLWSVLPTLSHISWEGHLFGLIAGGFAGYFLSIR